PVIVRVELLQLVADVSKCIQVEFQLPYLPGKHDEVIHFLLGQGGTDVDDRSTVVIAVEELLRSDDRWSIDDLVVAHADVHQCLARERKTKETEAIVFVHEVRHLSPRLVRLPVHWTENIERVTAGGVGDAGGG